MILEAKLLIKAVPNHILFRFELTLVGFHFPFFFDWKSQSWRRL